MTTSTVGSPCASYRRMAESRAETADLRWNWLYKIGGAAWVPRKLEDATGDNAIVATVRTKSGVQSPVRAV
ncbi:MAG TPA: hypothetical protein DEP84_31815 [Chloroflexi bacterium]|nr:hypothetical protein [Chloroflexota bacterium]